MSQPQERLEAGAVHVWFARPERIADEALLDAYEALLTTAERRSLRRLVRAEDRRERLVARALVRISLARYAAVEPGRWRFVTGAHGRPEVAAALGTRLRFNLSHTRGLVACAVALERDVGVDVEANAHAARIEDLADRLLSAAERAALGDVPAALRPAHLLRLWTLKESYLKARGLGLSAGLERVSFQVGAGDVVVAAFDAGLDDDPAGWHFALRAPTPEHAMALAVRRAPGHEPSVSVREIVPLRD